VLRVGVWVQVGSLPQAWLRFSVMRTGGVLWVGEQGGGDIVLCVLLSGCLLPSVLVASCCRVRSHGHGVKTLEGEDGDLQAAPCGCHVHAQVGTKFVATQLLFATWTVLNPWSLPAVVHTTDLACKKHCSSRCFVVMI
jgi:hypothetical protein